MRYEKGHKEATRKRILSVAARRFRRDGVEAVGVAGLMADAGLTHGGFYSHFKSKEDLVREAVIDSLDQMRGALARAAAPPPDSAAPGGIEGVIRSYLGPLHRDAPERGCLAAALTAELARHPEETRAAFTDRLLKHVAVIAGLLPPALPEEVRQQRALAIFGSMMGTLQLARAVNDQALSDRILEGGVTAALALAAAPAAPTSDS